MAKICCSCAARIIRPRIIRLARESGESHRLCTLGLQILGHGSHRWQTQPAFPRPDVFQLRFCLDFRLQPQHLVFRPIHRTRCMRKPKRKILARVDNPVGSVIRPINGQLFGCRIFILALPVLIGAFSGRDRGAFCVSLKEVAKTKLGVFHNNQPLHIVCSGIFPANRGWVLLPRGQVYIETGR